MSNPAHTKKPSVISKNRYFEPLFQDLHAFLTKPDNLPGLDENDPTPLHLVVTRVERENEKHPALITHANNRMQQW